MAASGRLGLSLRGLLRFAALLVAACLIGALFGLLTEPIGTGSANTRKTTTEGPASGTPQGADLADAPRDDGSPGVSPPARNATEASAREAFTPDLRGIYIAGGVLLAFVGLAIMFSRKTRGARPGNGAVHLVDTLHLGAGRRVHLLRIDGRRFLVGNSERGLTFLASVPQSDAERAFDTAMGASADELEAAEGEPTFDRSLVSALSGSAVR